MIVNVAFVQRAVAALLFTCGVLGVRPVLSQEVNPAFPQEVDPVLIDKLETFQTLQSKASRKVSAAEFLPRMSAKEQEITETLGKTTALTFVSESLRGPLDYLKETHGIDIWIDSVRVNVDDYLVTLDSTNVSVRSALNLLLEPHGLCFLVEDDVLKVTTMEAAAQKLITRTYPVGDLFTSPEEAEELTAVLECGLGITRRDDGSSALKISSRSRSLVLRQTHQVHDQLLQLLRDLRMPSEDSAATEVVLNLGFTRFTTKRGDNDFPFITLRESRVEGDQIAPTLRKERNEIESKHGKTALQSATVQIRAETDVPYKLLVNLIEKCREAGFVKFNIQSTHGEN